MLAHALIAQVLGCSKVGTRSNASVQQSRSHHNSIKVCKPFAQWLLHIFVYLLLAIMCAAANLVKVHFCAHHALILARCGLPWPCLLMHTGHKEVEEMRCLLVEVCTCALWLLSCCRGCISERAAAQFTPQCLVPGEDAELQNGQSCFRTNQKLANALRASADSQSGLGLQLASETPSCNN